MNQKFYMDPRINIICMNFDRKFFSSPKQRKNFLNQIHFCLMSGILQDKCLIGYTGFFKKFIKIGE